MVGLVEIREAIAHAGLGWRAGTTSVSGRLKPGTQAYLGLNRPIPEENRTVAPMAPPEPPPAEVDWRDRDGSNWVSPMCNQGACASSVGFATIAALESRLAIAAGSPQFIRLSPAHLFFCGAGRACRAGWTIEAALAHCRDAGVGLEADFPYAPSDQPCRAIRSRVFVRDWHQPAGIAAAKWEIAANGPVIAAMKVHEDLAWYREGIYRHAAGAFAGWQAVCVVGYNSSPPFWIIKNSWGTSWGEQGYVRLELGPRESDLRLFAPSTTVR